MSNHYNINLAKLLHADPTVDNQDQLVFEHGQIKVKFNAKEKKITYPRMNISNFNFFSNLFEIKTYKINKHMKCWRIVIGLSKITGWNDNGVHFALDEPQTHSSVEVALLLNLSYYIWASPSATSSTDL